jgi:hypothetical protein
MSRARPRRTSKTRRYFYTKIRFSTPGSSPASKSANTEIHSVDHAGNHARMHARSSCCSCCCSSSMHTGPCMLVHTRSRSSMHASHACRFLHACQLLLIRACLWRAYCKKCRVHLVPYRCVPSNIHVLIRYSYTPSSNTTIFSVLWPPSIALWGSLVLPYTLVVQ